VYGRPEILHSRAIGSFIMRMYGFGPRQMSQMNGKSSPIFSPSGILASVAPGLFAASAIMSAELRRESCTGGLSINWPSLMAAPRQQQNRRALRVALLCRACCATAAMRAPVIFIGRFWL
jgi:hypothetical protein